jgi:hypothetical protein
MGFRPLLALPDQIITDRKCSICGAAALGVVHVKDLPDFILCSDCDSSFLVATEDAYVMYGKIPNSFPETQQLALGKWMLAEEVSKIALGERWAKEPPAEVAVISPEPESLEPKFSVPTHTEPELAPESSGPSLSALLKEAPMPVPEVLLESEESKDSTLTTQQEQQSIKPTLEVEPAPVSPPRAEKVAKPAKAVPEEAAKPEERAQMPVAPVMKTMEPEPNRRYRIIIRGREMRFPNKLCAHCLSSPIQSWLAVSATIPGETEDQAREVTKFRVPLCSACRKRAADQGEPEKKARKQAIMISALVALALVLIALGTGLIAGLENLLLAAFLLIILAVLGFGIPALILLARCNNYPPPSDAVFVLSTLYIPPSSPANTTIFDWRNRGYAELFYRANRNQSLEPVQKIEDQGPKISPPEEQLEAAGDSKLPVPPDASADADK